jgi:ABC-type multidrug transport system ATPase subunit
MESAATTQRLCKVYDAVEGYRRQARKPKVTAVDDITLSVNKGELFGLLGSNGAGKTTLVKILCTLIIPSSGAATVAGHNLTDDTYRTYTVNTDPLDDVDLTKIKNLIPTLQYVSSDKEQTSQLQFRATRQDNELTAVIDHLRQRGFHIHTIEGTPPTLEEVFTHYTVDALKEQ